MSCEVCKFGRPSTRGVLPASALVKFISGVLIAGAVPVLAASAEAEEPGFPSSPMMAQSADPPPPPQQDTNSGTGVSLVSGGYSTSATDLAIGQGQFPQALSLSREYSSSLNKSHGTNDGIRGWGWSTNLTMYITVGELGAGDYPPDEPPVDNERYPWRYGIAQGTRTLASFVEFDPRSDPIIGPNYEGPFGRWGSPYEGSLVRTGDDLVFTATDGTKHFFEGGGRQTFRDNTPTFRTRLEAKDGTVLTFHGTLGAKSVFSNRGIAILFEFDSDGRTWTKACAVNLTKHFVTANSNCPSGVPAVTYNHSPMTDYGGFAGKMRVFNSSTNQLGQTTTYQYTSEKQLNCIKMPSQSGCRITNYYSNCLQIPNEPANVSMNAFQQVYRQVLNTGERIDYSFDLQRYCPLRPPGSGRYSAPYADDVTMTYSDGSTKTVRATYEGLPLKITDGLGHETNMVHGIENFANRPILLTKVIAAEGNSWNYNYHGTGKIKKTTLLPKSGTGGQVWETIYGGPGICYQPTAHFDAEGNRTDLEYSSLHCGILKRTSPPDANGIRPETRYSYVQKHAWVKSGGGFVQEPSPVWVLASEEYCRTSAADAGGNCAAGSGDKVVTTYEYQQGNSAKGSNAWMIGMAVSADGQTLRTCYGYDDMGRRISETPPAAGLASCP